MIKFFKRKITTPRICTDSEIPNKQCHKLSHNTVNTSVEIEQYAVYKSSSDKDKKLLYQLLK